MSHISFFVFTLLKVLYSSSIISAHSFGLCSNVKNLVVAGGVAANSALREELEKLCVNCRHTTAEICNCEWCFENRRIKEEAIRLEKRKKI